MGKKTPNPIDVHVGGRVKQARMMLGMSQQAVARPLNLTFQQVQKYERGTNRIGSSRLHQIAAIVGKPVAWFFEGLPENAVNVAFVEAGDDPLSTLGSTKDGIRLARAFNSIPDQRVRAGLLSMAEAWVDVLALAKQQQAA